MSGDQASATKAEGERERSESETAPYDLSDNRDLFRLIKEEEDDNVIKAHVGSHVLKIIRGHKLDSYTPLMLFDDVDPLSGYHSDNVYRAASAAGGKNDILLFLDSSGGSIEQGYLISKTCSRLSKSRFVVAVPRRAKSAATLLALGANEVHVGLMSEFGPIDPQVGKYPALGLANALNTIAELSSRFPQSSEMLALYLTKTLNLQDLGYFERVSESAAQYAERLLSNKDKLFPEGRTAENLADHFVNHYKDHRFVIDSDELTSLLGDKIVKAGTVEYRCANDIYEFLDFMSILLRIVRKQEYYYVGSVEKGLSVRKHHDG